MLFTICSLQSPRSKAVFIKFAELRSGSSQTFELPVRLTAGQSYRAELIGLNNLPGSAVCQKNTIFRAELSLDDVSELDKKAIVFAGSSNAPVVWLYRNKSFKYFDDVILNQDEVMKPYLKDNSGDPGSSINGRLSGLFFMASVKPGSREGEPYPRSAFGDTRLCVPVDDLIKLAPNLYFADFYCMLTPKKHYVTLVMTKPGTPADRFCSEHLISLSWNDPTGNPFLFVDSNQEFRVSAKRNLFIECMVTEDVDIRPYTLTHDVKKIGKGKTTKGGRPKNPTCTKCNLNSRFENQYERVTLEEFADIHRENISDES